MRQNGNYGVDAPRVVFALLGFGVALPVAGALLRLFALLPRDAARPFFRIGLGWFAIGLWMLYGSKVGKIKNRERLLDMIPWRGDERVLDVGCGRGLLLTAAARRLGTGRAFGVDIWQTEDQSGNHPDRTRENARTEGVADKVEIATADARALPFEDGSFDVVVSSWALHNIYNAAGRRKAIEEIARVLRPGGRVLISDVRHTRQYAKVLRECRLADVARSWPRRGFDIVSRVVTAKKPA